MFKNKLPNTYLLVSVRELATPANFASRCGRTRDLLCGPLAYKDNSLILFASKPLQPSGGRGQRGEGSIYGG